MAASGRRSDQRGRSPGIRRRVKTAATIQPAAVAIETTPDDHLLVHVVPHRGVTAAAAGRARSRNWVPGAGGRVVACAGIRVGAATRARCDEATPDDHLRTGPHRTVSISA